MAFQIGKKKERLQTHIGIHDSANNQAWRKCEALMKLKRHISAAIEKQSEQAKKNYQIHLTATIDCIRFLLRQGLAFRGNDEVDDSVNQGNFSELLNFLVQHNEEIDRALKNARGNLKLRAPSIQKDIVRAAASETTKVIVNDFGDELFATLVDEAHDISIKEQMSVCLRYVNKEGQVREHFLGLVHVSNTNALSLKLALESLLETYNLSLSRVRGQGYDGTTSCKRRDMLRDSQMTKTIEALQSGEIASGRGLNQEIALKRVGDTRWGRSRRKAQKISNLHHFQVEIFYHVVDRQLQELNNRFTEVNTELLLCIACLNPRQSFLAFDNEKLIQLARFYPLEFSSTQLLALDSQLENFILDVRSDDQFSNLNGIGALSQKLIETRKNIVYPLVLLKLALVLPVVTALVERTFYAMNIIKSRLRSRMGDEFLNDCLVTYIERETFDCIDNEKCLGLISILNLILHLTYIYQI
ncbi:uncharacterized protein LOC107486280 [Arachis duranensis]|uniref:Uncharacterized protein LOC107486280 n=1 Tax=Arachis duranensis TaxID=130453 RepID=A0A6P5NIB1_ARADU|nr:uncharacterized protein LOC107486280 [Arachis duranensis]